MSYIDTSVIVAALDPRCEKARTLLEEEENKTVSELVLAELASIVARRRQLVSSVAEKLGLSVEETLTTILTYILKRFNLRYRSTYSSTRLSPLDKMYKPIATSIELSLPLRLRTLDLLHVAYAKLIKGEGEPIQKLVTADKEFEKAQKTLKEEIGIDLHVIQP